MAKIKRKPKRIRKKKAWWRNLYFRLTIFCLILLLEIFYLLLFSSLFQLKEIIIAAPEGMPRDVFQKIVEEKIAKKILFFPTKSIFLASPRPIKQVILERYSQIARVAVKREMPSRLVVEIRNRQAIANWCREQEQPFEEGEETQERCFFIDEQGIIFKEAFAAQEAPDLVIASQGEQPKEPGQRAIENEMFSLILEIERALAKDRQIGIERFVIAPDKLIAKTRPAEAAEGVWQIAEIYFDLEGDIKEQLSNLGLLLEEDTLLKDRPIQYIDLRFGNKVFYK